MAQMLLPRTIDEPPYFMIWRVDDAMVPFFGLTIGFLVGEVAVLFGLGVLFSFAYRKFREGRPEMWVVHAVYWQGLYPDRGHTLFNPFEREIRA